MRDHAEAPTKRAAMPTITKRRGPSSAEPGLGPSTFADAARRIAQAPAVQRLRSAAGSICAAPANIALDAIQRKISYARGGYADKEALQAALHAIFTENAHSLIDASVDAWEAATHRAVFASEVFRNIVNWMREQGHDPTYAIVCAASSSRHGPQMPTRVNRSADDDENAARTTFNFPTVTLARAVLSNGATAVNFHDRQINSNFHAEDGIIEQLGDYIRNKGIETSQWRFNLTINNFFCTHETTGKSCEKQNCLDQIIALQRANPFARFHVYFAHSYGNRAAMIAAVKRLQDEGVLVTAFTTGARPIFSVSHDEAVLDPVSESEDDSDNDDGQRKHSRAAPQTRSQNARHS